MVMAGKRQMKTHFTLIEVIVAMAILSLSLAGMMQLLTQSQTRIGEAMEKWREMHMLSLGTEYIMLAGTEENLHVPDEIFPYTDYLVECEVESADDLPDELKDQEDQLPLKKWTVKLIRVKDRVERKKVVIDRLDYSGTEAEIETLQ